jgi:hypothetical protein
MRTAFVLVTAGVLAVSLSGCLVWHTEDHEDDDRDYRLSRACGQQICSAGQSCVRDGDLLHCE